MAAGKRPENDPEVERIHLGIGGGGAAMT